MLNKTNRDYKQTNQKTMVHHKLFLIACFHASNANAEKVAQISARFQDSSEFIDAIIVLWPELDDPMNLKFLFHTPPDTFGKSDSELVIEQVAEFPELMSMIEMDDDTVKARYQEIQQFIRQSLQPFDNYHWFQQRVLLCNEMNPSDTLFYGPLWEVIEGQDDKLDQWMEGVVKPLAHYNKRMKDKQQAMLSINQFIELLDKEDEQDMADLFGCDDSDQYVRELIPIMKYNKKYYQLYLRDYYQSSKFIANNINDYIELRDLSQLLMKEFEQDKSTIASRTLDILFENSDKLSLVVDMKQISQDFLIKLQDYTIKLSKYNITNHDLQKYCDFVEQYVHEQKEYTFKQLYTITRDDRETQLLHYTTLCGIILRQGDSQLPILLESFPIFNKLDIVGRDKTQIIIIVLETILQLERYDMIDKLFYLDNGKHNEALLNVLVNTFWQYFHGAKEMNSLEMTNAKVLLDCITQFDLHHKFSTRLNNLVDLCQDLYLSSNWKFSSHNHHGNNNNTSDWKSKWTKQVKGSPHEILDFHSCPLEIIRVLMEMNPTFYQQDIKDVTWPLWTKILIGLQCQESENDYSKLLALHIDYSLVFDDFTYASAHVDELLSHLDESLQEETQSHWLTVFQVGKYQPINSSEYNGDDVTVEIARLSLQRDILSKLLRVCPVDEVSIVTQQWNQLNNMIEEVALNGLSRGDDVNRGSTSRLLGGYV